MVAALRYAKYEVEFQVGKGGHTLAHGGALFGKGLLWMCEHPDGEFKDEISDDEGEEEEDGDGDDEEDEDEDD